MSGKGVHDKDGHGMIGYCAKEIGQPHSRLWRSEALTDALLSDCRRVYLLNGNVSTKGKSKLTPHNLGAKLVTFVTLKLLPPGMPVHSVLVRKVRSKLYYFTSTWVVPTYGRPLNFERVNAYYRILLDPENVRLDDLQVVAFEHGSKIVWTEEDATESVPLTQLEIAAALLRASASLGHAAAPPQPCTIAEETLEHNLRIVRTQTLRVERTWLPNEKPILRIHYGESRTGKSRFAFNDLRNRAPPVRYFQLNVESGVTVWWDGYNGGTTLICNDVFDTDDANKMLISFRMMKTLVDFAPAAFQTRDGMPRLVSCLVKESIFTSTVPPEFWYVNHDGTVKNEWRQRVIEFGVIYKHTAWGVPPTIMSGREYFSLLQDDN